MNTPCSNHDSDYIFMDDINCNKTDQESFDDLIEAVKIWADSRKLLQRSNINAQMLKVMEEIGETAAAIARGQRNEMIDGIGDSFVTLIILAYQNGIDPTDALRRAWNEIKDRKGKTENGVFVKMVDL
jgi:NTP pyrophosphatase (non-canonical NTP hydrolase)